MLSEKARKYMYDSNGKRETAARRLIVEIVLTPTKTEIQDDARRWE